jgi:hypothetical protein
MMRRSLRDETRRKAAGYLYSKRNRPGWQKEFFIEIGLAAFVCRSGNNRVSSAMSGS